jgi:monoamine oxidase
MNRRRFLSDALVAGVSVAALPRIAFPRRAPAKVLVIGAGLSGLVAAYELRKQGYDLTVLEAQNRPGGRVHTLRSFGEKLWADAGAARIPNSHDLTLKYVNEFKLPLLPFYPTEDKFRRLTDGKPEAVGWDGFREATSFVMSLNKPSYWRKIDGGNDLLPKAFATSLGTSIHYDSPVIKIEQDDKKVRVAIRNNGSVGSVEGDYLLCAVPATMLSAIDVGAALPQVKIDAIRSIKYDSASRVFLETKVRFWLEDKWNGFGFGDDSAEVWNSTFGEGGTHGILQSYLRGGYSMNLTRMSEPDRIQYTISKLSTLFPALNSNVIKGLSKCWSEDPWVKGAWAHSLPNNADLVRSPERRIFFAGEHISNNPSWMQGALESGLRVVNEIAATATAAVI